jgi:hypothetical protein
MKNKGIKRTSVPLLFEVNYPEHGQVGFVVRLNRRGKRVYSIFNYSQFPSKPACRKAALQYAQQLARQFPKLSRQELATLRGKKNSGVRRVVNKSAGRDYAFWEASWSPKPNQVKRVKFSVKKYGNERAKKLAIAARNQGVKAMK